MKRSREIPSPVDIAFTTMHLRVPKMYLGKIGGSIISTESMKSLTGELSDEIMSSYLQTLQTRYPQFYAVDPFIWKNVLSRKYYSDSSSRTRTLYLEDERDELMKAHYIGGILHEPNKHWTTLLIDMQNKQVIYMNSMGETYIRKRTLRNSWMSYAAKSGLGTEWEVIVYPHSMQADSTTCGIYALAFLESILMKNVKACLKVNIEDMRNEIACSIARFMGKIHCEGCKKSCKGQAIRLQDTYFHIKCFKCKECKKQLAAGGFYTKDGQYFCGDDYQKLFGTKCAACGKYVEGEVVTALGNTYHQTCFHCTRCDKTFGPGDKVTYTGKDYLCNACLEETSAVTTPQEEAEHTPNGKPVEPMEVPQVAINAESIVKPAASSTPARPLQDGPAIRATTDNTLNSPISDMSDIYTDKENVTNGDRAVSSPVSTTRTSGYRSDAESPRPQMSPHNTSHYSRDSSLFDEFLAMPDRKGRDSGYMPSHNETLDSVTDSVFVDNTHTDTDRQERLSPVQNMMQYRSPSPCTSTVSKSSRKSRDSTLSSSSRREVDYGKFYNTSYLQKPSGAQIKGPSINPKGDPKSPHYHRPENFSYSQVRRDFIKPLKKESSSMMSALGETMTVQKKKLEDFMEEPMKNKEVIDLARFPDNTKHDGDRQFAIEREDFPAPPATAAAYPELLYKQYKPPRKSRGSDVDSPDGGQQMEVDGEEVPEVDPKLLKDIDHLSKLERESGAAKVILEHLKKKSKEPPPPIDPVSSSRTPAADREPMYKTRYESHVFASPSRDLDHRSRMYSLDDQIIGRKYRSALQSVGNFPVDRRTYDLPKARSNKYTVMKPGYTLRQPKTAHMPSTFASARANGYFSDIEQCVTRDSDFEDLEARRYDVLERRALNFNRRDHELDRRSQELDRRSQELDRRSQDLDQRSQDAERRSQKSHSLHASQSSIEYEYDPITGLRRGTKLRGSSVSSDLMKTKSPYQKTLASFKSDDPPQIYDYDDLKITNLNLPPGVDRNVIEIHLSQQEFESIFRMSREEFYRLAEWKRNDMKQRVLLF